MTLQSSGIREVVASLEGMKILARETSCELYEYNFEFDAWQHIANGDRPMKPSDAKKWLQGWNPVDGSAAFILLTHSASDWE